MIAQAIDAIRLLADSAHAPRKLDVPLLGETAYMVGDQVVKVVHDGPRRDHGVNSLAEVISLANRFAAEDDTPADDQKTCVVWYDAARVVLVIDDDGHQHHRVTFALATSDAFATVERLAQSKAWHDQREFVRLLRIDLGRTLDERELLANVRKVKFEELRATTGHITRSSESLGREIAGRVSSAEGEMPEQVGLTLPVYKSPGERDAYVLDCSVEVDAMAGKFRLLPLPDELERVRELAVESIGRRLKAGLEERVPAYHGTP